MKSISNFREYDRMKEEFERGKGGEVVGKGKLGDG